MRSIHLEILIILGALLFSGSARADSFVKMPAGPTAFEDLIDHTITLKTKNGSFQGFYCEEKDTVWIKKVNRPKEGKHFRLEKKVYYGDSFKLTPSEHLNNKHFLVLDVDRSSDTDISSTTGRSLTTTTVTIHLRDIENNILLYWQLEDKTSNYYKDSNNYDGIQIIIESISKEIYNSLQSYDFYDAKSKTSSIAYYQRVHLNAAEYTLTPHVSPYLTDDFRKELFFTGTISNSSGTESPYSFDNSQPSLISVAEYNSRLEDYYSRRANDGHYIIKLSKVQKPANSKIQRGEISIQDVNNNSLYSDNFVIITLGFTEKSISLFILNRTDYSMKLLWDEASFITPSGKAQRVIHNGIRLADKSQPQAPSVIPGHSTINDSITPAENITYSSYLLEWITSPLLDNLNRKGTYSDNSSCSLLLPIQISGVTNEYTFIFGFDWVYNDPLFREDYLKTHQ